ncbi:hypothetical protein [uncultured Pseudokineococcus sp.]|uniref:flagellin N-terminal helical domain-containing protein n=1 Tax=uncultured Pseudokineococcus sp. TaxID=1642928 RepID=UPI0026230E1C|nr:hypothetical protein [uncultured Pseudokineococcus sp.]
MSGISASLTGAGLSGRSTLQGSGGAAHAGISAAAARYSRTMDQVSSGRAIGQPSDDVIGTDKALGIRQALAAEERFARASTDATSWLSTTDTALGNGATTLNRVRDLTVRAGAESMSAQEREAIATEIRGLRSEMLATTNATYLGRPVFGGTTGTGKAFTEVDGVVAPTADPGTGVVRRALAPGVEVRVDTSRAQAFGEGETSVFAVLDRVEKAVTAGSAESSAALTDVDGALGRLRTAWTDVGTRYAQVDRLRSTGTDRSLSLTAAKADVEEVDLAKSLMELSMHEKAYQAALGAAAKVVTPTIMDFLR